MNDKGRKKGKFARINVRLGSYKAVQKFTIKVISAETRKSLYLSGK